MRACVSRSAESDLQTAVEKETDEEQGAGMLREEESRIAPHSPANVPDRPATGAG